MLISQKMNDALNEQIGNEFGASLQYVAIAGHFEGEGLRELGTNFFKQADEERDHAMRIVRYLLDAGAHVHIPTIPAPKSDFKSVEEAVRLSLEWEKAVTQQINNLVELSIRESDHTTKNMLDWFVKEQLEEVSTMDNLLKVVRRAGEANLLYVEDYLARHEEEQPAAQ